MAPLSITKAEHEAAFVTRVYGAQAAAARGTSKIPPDQELIHLTFSDGSEWAIYPESMGDPRTYAHELLDAFIASGGTVS